jgi:GntR family carbon starvation induced transcriptional regulator
MAAPARTAAQLRPAMLQRKSVSNPERVEATLSQEAYRRLRLDIIAGVFEAGSPLRLEGLKERYGLSFSPLREALNRLHAERLVVASALRGFRVAEFSVAEMWDAIDTHILIDNEALRRSIKCGNDDWEAGLVGAFHALSRCVQRGAMPKAQRGTQLLEELEIRHRDFHTALIAHCGSQRLVDFSGQLYAQTERYRGPAIQGRAASLPHRDIDAEHRAIMDAALSRETDKAVRLLTSHYRLTGEMIEVQLAKLTPARPAGRPLSR